MLDQRVLKQLAEDTDDEYSLIDATIVRAHQHSAIAEISKQSLGNYLNW
jgi:hypothetical protein